MPPKGLNNPTKGMDILFCLNHCSTRRDELNTRTTRTCYYYYYCVRQGRVCVRDGGTMVRSLQVEATDTSCPVHTLFLSIRRRTELYNYVLKRIRFFPDTTTRKLCSIYVLRSYLIPKSYDPYDDPSSCVITMVLILFLNSFSFFFFLYEIKFSILTHFWFSKNVRISFAIIQNDKWKAYDIFRLQHDVNAVNRQDRKSEKRVYYKRILS